MQTSYDANPWSQEEDQKFGNTNRLLSLARNLGYQFDNADQTERQRHLLEQSDGMRLLNLMSDITTAENKLHSVNAEIERMLLDKDTHDITNITELESRVSQLHALSSHLGEAVDNKAAVTKRLQQPYRCDNMKVDTANHKYVVDFFMTLGPLLSDLGYLLDTVTWTAENHTNFSRTLDLVLYKLNSSLAALRKQVDTIAKLRNVVSNLSNQSVSSRTMI